jgi:predicted DNA-binding WGR domain protein
VRTFTYVADTSRKFWEVDRDGASVTVRFGRIGTKGQTQTKDLGTPDKARAYVDKLVSEKVGKGYVEDTAGVGPATPSSAPAKPAKARKPRAAAPAAAAPESPAPESPAPRDEDTWEVPASWRRQAQPWRGRIAGKPPAVDPRAPEVADAIHQAARQAVDAALDDPRSDPELVAAARLHRGTGRTVFRKARQEPNPLGAAVLDAIVGAWIGYPKQDERLALLDAHVVRYGLPFAVRATMLMQTMSAQDPDARTYSAAGATSLAVTRRPSGRSHYHAMPALERLRALLAAAPDAGYAEAVAAASETRPEGLEARIVSSYLFPTEQAWVAADVAELAAGGTRETLLTNVLWASVGSRAQANDLLRVGHGFLGYQTSWLYTAATVLGPEVTDLLLALFDGHSDAAGRKRVLAMLGQIPTDEAFAALVRRLDEKYVVSALVEPMARFPRRAARLLANAAGTPAARELLRVHLVSHPGLAEGVAASEPSLGKVASDLIAGVGRVADAPDAAVPDVLRSPPWEGHAARPKPVTLALTSPGAPHLEWQAGERAEWAATNVPSWKPPGKSWAEVLRSGLDDWSQVRLLASAPEDLVRPLLAKPGLAPRYLYDAFDPLRKLLGVHGEAALPYVMRVVRMQPTSLAPVLLPVNGPEAAAAVAGWYARSKPLRAFARTWLRRHAATAARDLLPAALGKPGKERTAAESALRALDRSVVIEAAAAYGADVAAAAGDLLDMDPLHVLPAKMPAFPSWLDVAHLSQVLVRDRDGALPPEAVRNLVLMLMLCKPGETYPGVAVVKEACDAASLAEWAWSVFERWRVAEYPSRDGWVLEALALLGDDETVRRLAPLIRAWPGESAHARAVTALDVLRGIGSDVALMHLHRISEKASFKGLRAKARERLAEIADDLGLTSEQLADRLVPDLGLDERGTMLLDYGARRFTVGFDEQLKPTVIDEDGSRRAVLPKPSAKDDPELAPAAYARFGGLKKDVKVIAQDQVRRLERAMVAGRTWTSEEFRALFVEHPLVWHLARRLVWRTADGTSFRVAEDRSLADSRDEELAIPHEAVVSLAHPLHLGEAELPAWSEVFADYEILQPFAQLAREVYRLDAAEKEAKDLARYHLTGVPTGRVLGLTSRGWERGAVQDGGVSVDTYRHVGGDRYVVLDLDPGLIVGTPMDWPEQQIAKVYVSQGRPDWGSGSPLPLGALDDVAASELIRDLEALKG